MISVIAFVLGTVGLVLIPVGVACYLLGLIRGDLWLQWIGDGLLGFGELALVLPLAITGDWIWAAIAAATGAWLLWQWWRKRKQRRRAPKGYGYKARAAIAALVAKLRESAQPRPVLRPVPGRAG